MSWQLPLSLLASSALLASATVYASVNDHRSRLCGIVADKVPYKSLREAGDFTTQSRAFSEEEFAYGVSIEECRQSLVPWR